MKNGESIEKGAYVVNKNHLFVFSLCSVCYVCDSAQALQSGRRPLFWNM